MHGTADGTQTGQGAEPGENEPGSEADVIAEGIPPELVGETTDIVSRDWVGSGHDGPSEEAVEQ